jgi:hypothetical protein
MRRLKRIQIRFLNIPTVIDVKKGKETPEEFTKNIYGSMDRLPGPNGGTPAYAAL